MVMVEHRCMVAARPIHHQFAAARDFADATGKLASNMHACGRVN
jgi:hypothetical protein